ncbi:MAG: hypothetical protein QW327_00165 [Candidatus Odinarchaeota archaeon]
MDVHPKYYSGMGLFMLFLGALSIVSGAIIIMFPSISMITGESTIIVGIVFFALGAAQFINSSHLLGKKDHAYNLTTAVLIWDIALKCYALLNGYQLGTLFLISLTLIFVQLIAKKTGHPH